MKQWHDYLSDAEKALNISNPKYLTMEDYKSGMKEAHELLRKARAILQDLVEKKVGL